MSGYEWVTLADATGAWPAAISWQRDAKWCHHPQAQLFIADVTGDRLPDLVCHDRANGWKWIAQHDGAGQFWRGTSWDGPYARWCSHSGAELRLARIDTDAKHELLCHDRNDGRKWVSWLPTL